MTVTSDHIAKLTDLLEAASQNKSELPHLPEDSLSALYSMAFELYRNGKYEDARGFFRFLTLVDSFDRRYWMGLAACYQMLKCYPEAIECYSAAAIQDSTDPYVHWHAADCFFHSGKLVEAKQALESAMITAQEDDIYKALIPKLTLITEAWANLPIGANHG